MSERRSCWGWGFESQQMDAAERDGLRALLGELVSDDPDALCMPPRVEELTLPAPRIQAPEPLRAICDDTVYARASHSYGKSFRDVVRGLSGQYDNPPDLVAYPRSEQDIEAVMAWCEARGYALIPYGGGSSVTGGVEAPPRDGFDGVVTLDLQHLDAVLEVDPVSRAARIQGGIYGPALEAGLKPHGFTLRHFPQSFEFSTLGGWIATRAGGHFATRYTHIDDFVQAVRMVTPRGVMESRRLPGSGAGPSPDRLMLGSEGTLGVITEAWMRLQSPPTFRASASVTFDDYGSAVQCTRQLSQSGLEPANCRLLDHGEALVSSSGDGSCAVLLLAFESHDHAPGASMSRALEICTAHGGRYAEGEGAVRSSSGEGERSGAAGAWRKSFVRAPYLRDALLRLGLIVETFETAVTWDRFADLHQRVRLQVQAAIDEVCGRGTITCRFTHLYPDGPAPYYTVIAAGKPGGRLAQWAEIKAAASEALSSAGGTITHHHAVGRDHRPWYDRERPEPFAAALRGAKQALDPAGILNPGLLIDP